jgi:carbohydrate kinase (thermoresistant glucokinase family)
VKEEPTALILMGVSGCGKTSVGLQLSQRLGWPFYDGDDFHPRENVEKMATGIPLDDNDRVPWLKILRDLIARHLARGESVLLACSALKQSYRDQLADGNLGTVFVHLKGDYDLILSRMQARAGHYMKAEMLQSQFATLEAPADALTVDIGVNLDRITEEIITQLHL